MNVYFWYRQTSNVEVHESRSSKKKKGARVHGLSVCVQAELPRRTSRAHACQAIACASLRRVSKFFGVQRFYAGKLQHYCSVGIEGQRYTAAIPHRDVASGALSPCTTEKFFHSRDREDSVAIRYCWSYTQVCRRTHVKNERTRACTHVTCLHTCFYAQSRSSGLVFGAANGLGFGISALTGSHLHLDLLGTGAFVGAAVALRGKGCSRQRLSAALIGLWGGKLAGFLFYRVCHTKHDARLDETLKTPSGIIGFWSISFIWGFFVFLPHTIAAAVPRLRRPPLGRALDVVGIALFGTGLALETAADLSKWTFKNKSANHGKFCDVGVWQLSQHPNWLGNLLIWSGIVSLNMPTLLSAGAMRTFAASASPAFLLALFTAQATGWLGNAVELSNNRYGSSAEYMRTWQQHHMPHQQMASAVGLRSLRMPCNASRHTRYAWWAFPLWYFTFFC